MKKVIIVLVIVSILIGAFLAINFFYVKNDFKRKDDNFYLAISALKEEDYRKAFEYSNLIDNIEEQKTIKNIIAHKYIVEINNSFDEINEMSEIMNNIVNRVSITVIYGKIEVDADKQQELDETGEKLYENYDNNILNKFPEEILYEDLDNLYTSFNKTMESYRGIYNNLEYKFINEKDNLVNTLNDFVNNLKELSNYIQDVSKLHPMSEVEEKYQIMFFDKK